MDKIRELQTQKKRGEETQTTAKPELTASKVYGGIGRELSTMKFWNLVKRSIRYFTVNN